jgi:zinc transporter ZupT
MVVPVLLKSFEKIRDPSICVIQGFAAGAISSCAFFLLLFEATHLIATDYTEEVDIIWRWGIMILAGYFFPACLQLLGISTIPAITQKGGETAVENNEETGKLFALGKKIRLITGILIGDFMHNLCDGFFIGAAFAGCGKSFAWKSVVISTIAHELPQEISDFALLIGPDVQMHWILALVLNFLSGTSVILGAIIVLANDVDDVDTGLLLAFAGGTYLHIAFSECMPRVYEAKVSIAVRALALVGFILGAVAIGLVLLDHEHCVPPAPPGPPGAAPAPSGGHHRL